ncbi:allantoinase PuuE [Aminobacter sp. MSH1]|uniref:allantoinase PuuE n=1 Tax=Aminobacter sp. MSH1 TaxID=374606 RepID=UPI0031B86715
MSHAPRDMVGYGRHTPAVNWPGGAKVAVQFVINYEEGAEASIMDGDAASEGFLSEMTTAQPLVGRRNLSMESNYEYGSRAGFWRLFELFSSRNMPLTVYGVAQALERNPEVARATVNAGWEIASHSYRWIDHKLLSRDEEKAHVAKAVKILTELSGQRPLGWYTGRRSEHSHDLVVEDGGFLYSSDSYADDLPYWVDGPHGPHLVVPYALDTNDIRFVMPAGFNSGDQFFTYLKDTFDYLEAEGAMGRPKMMSVGLHCRVAGRPGRAQPLARFADYVAQRGTAWVCRRVDLASHWARHHRPTGLLPSQMSRPLLMAVFGDLASGLGAFLGTLFDEGAVQSTAGWAAFAALVETRLNALDLAERAIMFGSSGASETDLAQSIGELKSAITARMEAPQ